MSDGALAALRSDPDAFAKELWLAAAIEWYEIGDALQVALPRSPGSRVMKFSPLWGATA